MLYSHFALVALALSVGLFLGMLVLLEVGRWFGLRQTAKFGKAARTGVGVVDSAVYALLALLLGFTFSGALTRFDRRRELIAQEAITISTAWARIDLVPTASQSPIRDGFRKYLDALIASHTSPSAERSRAEAAASRGQAEIWAQSVAVCVTPDGERARMLLLPSLNEMFDATSRLQLARRMHPPIVIYLLLAAAALATALFVGYTMANATTRNWLYAIGFAATISGAVYVIIELEFPRLGFIRVDAFDHALHELRATMK